MVTVHVQSVFIASTAGGIVAALYSIIPDPWFCLLIPGVLGFAVGYFCIGSAALLASFGVVPLFGFGVWSYLTGAVTVFVSAWYFGLAVAATAYAGAIYMGATARSEVNAP